MISVAAFPDHHHDHVACVDGALDAAATARHAAHLVQRGVRGVLVGGQQGRRMEAGDVDAQAR